MAPDIDTMETLIKSVERLEQDRDMAWKNVRILESARQKQDQRLKELTDLNNELGRQLASAGALIDTLQEQLK